MDTPAPAAGAITRPADAVEDPYVWHPAGAFGAQPIKAREAPPAPEPETLPSSGPTDANWRWRDFLIGLTFGAIAVTALSLVINFNRR